MGVGPSYGETPLDGEELDALEPRLLEEFAEPPGKADVFDLESRSLRWHLDVGREVSANPA